MIFEKFEIMKNLERQIKDNLFDLDSMLDLMSMEEYQDSDELQQAYENLIAKTGELKNEYFKICQELDNIDELASGL